MEGAQYLTKTVTKNVREQFCVLFQISLVLITLTASTTYRRFFTVIIMDMYSTCAVIEKLGNIYARCISGQEPKGTKNFMSL